MSADSHNCCAAANVPIAGGAIVQGLLDALSAVSPLSRVHKVYTVLLSLTFQNAADPERMLQSWVQNAQLNFPEGQ